MDPKINAEWSDSDIKMVKSLIASHNANNNHADDKNKKHNDIVNDIQAWFPLKERHQVIDLYVELVVEMINSAQSGNQSVVATNNLVSDNPEIPMEGPSMDNIQAWFNYEAPQNQVTIPQQQRQQKGRFWTIEEHRLIFFLYIS
jgi:hypothetical protein